MTANNTSGEKILIVDDDVTLLTLLRQSLERAGYQVRTATNGLAGLQEMYESHPDLVILDVMMPRMDGWETVSRIREISQVPVIMLTAKDEEGDKLRGFQAGADDYVTKPFSFAELTARVGAVLHRSRQLSAQKPARLHVFGELLIDLDNRRVTRNDQPIELTPTEFRLLATLVEHAGQVLSHEQLLTKVWGYEYANDVGYVKRYIWYLRQKIENDPRNPEYITTEWGFGYSFRKE
ncbi:MAG: response regulator transcription factor [Chloroflexi bacterium]|nr:response regulator transcription factor [Chloroflexota bacterium]